MNNQGNRFRIEISDTGYSIIDTRLWTVTSPNGLCVMCHSISKSNPTFETQVRLAMKDYGISEAAA